MVFLCLVPCFIDYPVMFYENTLKTSCFEWNIHRKAYKKGKHLQRLSCDALIIPKFSFYRLWECSRPKFRRNIRYWYRRGRTRTSNGKSTIPIKRINYFHKRINRNIEKEETFLDFNAYFVQFVFYNNCHIILDFWLYDYSSINQEIGCFFNFCNY